MRLQASSRSNVAQVSAALYLVTIRGLLGRARTVSATASSCGGRARRPGWHGTPRHLHGLAGYAVPPAVLSARFALLRIDES